MLERIVEKIQDSGERYAKERKTPHERGERGRAWLFRWVAVHHAKFRETKSFQYKLYAARA